MGKKGTKRKTKWRALPLGEEGGGSGNEEDLHDEDQSATSSVVGQPTSTSKRQSVYYRMAEKSYRQTKRFPYDRYRSKEPLVKLESKTFDEEEYTKITTPRQDVLFKKGYFGRKRESSVEETARHSGEADGEEPIMDQIIITNGFVDERGHYLVNGNSYEIYDPYTNTVTVVVGPPPYANGVTQPVLAAVSCQPVPLQPVDWYPPASDWPSQGSAWTPSYPRNPATDPLPSPPATATAPAPAPAPALYNQSAYVVPGLMYGESPFYNGVPPSPNDSAPATQATCSRDNGNDNKPKKTRRRKSADSSDECKELDKREESEEEFTVPEKESEAAPECSSTQGTRQEEERQRRARSPAAEEPTEATPRQVEKQSHSTQTNSAEAEEEKAPGRVKESHGTQTPSGETFPTSKSDFKSENKSLSEIILSSLSKLERDFEGTRKPQQKAHPDHCDSFQEEEMQRKANQQRTNFIEERKLKTENFEKSEFISAKVSYAKKAMSGLENSKSANGTNRSNDGKPFSNRVVRTSQHLTVNGTSQIPTTNGANKANVAKPKLRDRYNAFEDKRQGNGHAKTAYGQPGSGRSSSGGKNGNERGGRKEFKYSRRKVHLKPFDVDSEKCVEKKCEEIARESRSNSEKSSTVSELSSPTELSSGQNTPPEKLIVRKMEQKIANEINKSFKEKLKQNVAKESEEREGNKREEEKEERAEETEGAAETESPGKRKAGEGKKKKKGKAERESGRGSGKGGKSKKKKKGEEKSQPDAKSMQDASFLPQEPQDFLFGAWDGEKNLMSEIDSILAEDEEILKSLGIREDKMSFSKLPLHSDLLMMLPTLGWGRPKLKIEDFFGPAYFHSDLFTRRNITNMKSTKPEEFFASVVDGPAADKADKKKEPLVNGNKGTPKRPEKIKSAREAGTASHSAKKNGKTEHEESKGDGRNEAGPKEIREKDSGSRGKEGKLGIVEAVNSWLQEQGDAEKMFVDSMPADTLSRLVNEKEEEEEEQEQGEEREKEEKENKCVSGEKEEQKNGESNPVRASSGSGEDKRSGVDFREGSGRIRVANVINDGFRHLDKEFYSKRKNRKNRMYRSSSWDAKLSDAKIKMHFKFLTDSASFCQDLISDVRNGLPTKSEYATEELCDPRQSVSKYYTLAPGSGRGRTLHESGRGSTLHESDSDNEVFDALEYKFLTKENLAKQEAEAKTPDGTGNASITDSGVHSDMESSEDAANDYLKENACKLQ